MRAVLVSLLLCPPAYAWEATVGEICTLSHDMETAHVFLTYDPAQPLYTLTITHRTDRWAASPWFAMRFDGPKPIEIATALHTLSDDQTALTAADTGFGNVLDGLEYNETALAFTQDQVIRIPLDGAAPEVRKFRSCSGAQMS
ncbi:MAG: hypothetical protein GJ676_09665 [Rhodobacteraceae bacterium]|nr:hypothetical protein [Paracoccaceae bacterium]